MPHTPSPIRNTSDQMTSVEPTIRMPAWRSVSPKKRSTRRLQTSRTMPPLKRDDLTGARQQLPRRGLQLAHYLITRMFGCVASNVCVKT